MLPQRKLLAPTPPVVVGYINRQRIPVGAMPEDLCWRLRVWAEEFGYLWGGTYLAQSSDEETVAALARRAAADLSVEIVVVPDAHHFPRDQRELVTPARRIQVRPLR